MSILYESFTEEYSASTPIGYSSGTYWEAQTFTPALSHSISSIQIQVKRIGSPGEVTVTIETVSSREPTGVVLTTGTFDGNGLTTSYAWKECTFTAYALTAGTTYAIVIKALSGGSSDYVSAQLVRQSNGDTMYTNVGSRVGSTNSGTNWTVYDGTGGQADDDLLFKEYGDGFVLPSDAISRVTSLIHRYDRGTFTLEVNLGEVVADFGLPEWSSKPRKAYPETEEEMEAAIKEKVREAAEYQGVAPSEVAVTPAGLPIETGATYGMDRETDITRRTGLTGHQIAQLGLEIADIRMGRKEYPTMEEAFARLAEISLILAGLKSYG